MTVWRSIVAWLAAMSADPHAIEQERPKAHAAYRVAYATFAPADDPEPTPPPPPAPPKPTPRPTRDPVRVCKCEGACSPACTCGCHGAKAGAPCPDGTCPKSADIRGGG